MGLNIDPTAQDRLDRAKRTLNNYFRQVSPGWNWENENEIEQAVENIFEAAVIQAKAELMPNEKSALSA